MIISKIFTIPKQQIGIKGKRYLWWETVNTDKTKGIVIINIILELDCLYKKYNPQTKPINWINPIKI